MIKLRLFPVLMSVIVSVVVLFGGWFAYRSFAMENPLNHKIEALPGVKQANFSFNNQDVTVQLSLSQNADLRSIDAAVMHDGAKTIGNRTVHIDVKNPNVPKLEDWWSKSLFDVAQAMDTKQYAQIPSMLQKKAAQLPGLQVSSEMDNTNVYIRLTLGKQSKYIILPRQTAKLEVLSQ